MCKDSGESARMHRHDWAFAVRKFDEYIIPCAGLDSYTKKEQMHTFHDNAAHVRKEQIMGGYKTQPQNAAILKI